MSFYVPYVPFIGEFNMGHLKHDKTKQKQQQQQKTNNYVPLNFHGFGKVCPFWGIPQ